MFVCPLKFYSNHCNQNGTLKIRVHNFVRTVSTCLRLVNVVKDMQFQTIIPPLLGASPLGPVPIQGELEVQLNIVEAAISKVPLQMDSERQRAYLPKMPCQTPAYYPQVPLASVDSLDYYLRLSVETLFFIFYYMEVPFNHFFFRFSILISTKE